MKKGKVSKKLFFAWPTQTISYSVGSVLIGYVTYYATDFMGISAATAGIIFMISKIFDGFTDIVAGYLIDHTHTRWGKGRPYELALIGYWVSLVLIYSAPEMGISASCVYLFVMYSMMNSVFLTLMNCGGPVYLANALEDKEQSVSILAFTGFISLVFTMASSILLPQMVSTMGTTREGWMKMSMLLAIPFTLLGLVRFFVVKERQDVQQNTAKKIGIKDMIHLLLQNKYILIVSLVILVANLGSNIGNGVNTYYFAYIIGDLSLMSLVNISTLAIVIVMIFAPMLSNRFGFSNVMKATSLAGVFGYLLRLVAPTNIPLLFVSNIFAMMGFNTVFSFAGKYIIDCMDYGEWKTGIRSEGAISSVQSVAAKVGMALGAGAIGILMGLTGYDGNLDIQPFTANVMIVLLYSVVPAVLCLVQFILLHFYDLDKKLPQIQAELKEKRMNKTEG